MKNKDFIDQNLDMILKESEDMECRKQIRCKKWMLLLRDIEFKMG